MKPGRRLLPAAVLIAGGLGVHVFCQQLYLQRSEFLGKHDAGHQSEHAHVFWHSIYIGMGYVKNSEIPAYRDEVAMAKVLLVQPTAAYGSSEYEKVLKKETLELARRRPFLILENILAKLAVVLFYCICASNVGLYAATISGKPMWFEVAFWGAIGFSSLFGILVVPKPHYVLGLIAFATLYGLYSIEHAAEQPQLRHKLGWMRRVTLAGSN